MLYLYIFLFYIFLSFLTWRLQGQECTELDQWKWSWSASAILFWVPGQHVGKERNLHSTSRWTCAYLNKQGEKEVLEVQVQLDLWPLFPIFLHFKSKWMWLTYWVITYNVPHLLRRHSCEIELLQDNVLQDSLLRLAQAQQTVCT